MTEHVKKKKRKSPNGVATNKLVFSAYQGSNDDLFPHVLSLYVAPGSTVADTTYGKGEVFWREDSARHVQVEGERFDA